jgi:outer membrane autotransporter protein
MTTARKTKKLALWSNLWGDYAHHEKNDQNPAYRAKTGGVTLGVDKNLFDDFYVGCATAYTYSHVDDGSIGYGSVQGYFGNLYASWFQPYFYVLGAFQAAYNHYMEKRHVNYATGPKSIFVVDRYASANWGGSQVGGYLSIGALTHPWMLDISPLVTAEYYYAHQNSFKEAGADSIDLYVDSVNNDLLRLSFGVNVAKCFLWHKAKWIPEVEMSVIEQESYNKGRLRATMKGNTSDSFVVTGLNNVGTFFGIRAAITVWAWAESASFSLQYAGQFNEKYHDSQGSFQASYSF